MARLGLSPEGWRQRATAAIQLLDEWSAGDEHEQRETWTKLRHALDEDRAGGRTLFS